MVRYVDSVVQDHQEDRELRPGLSSAAAGNHDPVGAGRSAQSSRNGSYSSDRTDDTTLGQNEDVAEPMLRFNAYCAAAAAAADVSAGLAVGEPGFQAVETVEIGTMDSRVARFAGSGHARDDRRRARAGLCRMASSRSCWQPADSGTPMCHWCIFPRGLRRSSPSPRLISNATRQRHRSPSTLRIRKRSGTSISDPPRCMPQHRPTQVGGFIRWTISIFRRHHRDCTGANRAFSRLATSAGGTSNSDDFSFVNDGRSIEVNSDPVAGSIGRPVRSGCGCWCCSSRWSSARASAADPSRLGVRSRGGHARLADPMTPDRFPRVAAMGRLDPPGLHFRGAAGVR